MICEPASSLIGMYTTYSSRIYYLYHGSQLAIEGTGADGDDSADLDEFPPSWLDIDVGHLADNLRLRVRVSMGEDSARGGGRTQKELKCCCRLVQTASWRPIVRRR